MNDHDYEHIPEVGEVYELRYACKRQLATIVDVILCSDWEYGVTFVIQNNIASDYEQIRHWLGRNPVLVGHYVNRRLWGFLWNRRVLVPCEQRNTKVRRSVPLF